MHFLSHVNLTLSSYVFECFPYERQFSEKNKSRLNHSEAMLALSAMLSESL